MAKSCTDISWLNTLDSASNSTFDGAFPLGENHQKDGQEAHPETQTRRPGVQTHYAFSAFPCYAGDQGTFPTCTIMVSWKIARFCSRKRLRNHLRLPVVSLHGEIAEENHDDLTSNQSACFDLQSTPLLPFRSRVRILTGNPEHEGSTTGIRSSQFPRADASLADPCDAQNPKAEIHGEHACHVFPAFQCDAENLDSAGLGDIVVPQELACFGGREGSEANQYLLVASPPSVIPDANHIDLVSTQRACLDSRGVPFQSDLHQSCTPTGNPDCERPSTTTEPSPSLRIIELWVVLPGASKSVVMGVTCHLKVRNVVASLQLKRSVHCVSDGQFGPGRSAQIDGSWNSWRDEATPLSQHTFQSTAKSARDPHRPVALR